MDDDVDEKYFLSEKSINQLIDNGINDSFFNKDVSATIRCGGRGSLTEKHAFDIVKIGNTNPSNNGMNGNVFDENGISPTLSTNKGEGIKIKSATKQGYETATENDSINFTHPDSKTRRGRVGKSVAQTLDTSCNQGVIQLNKSTESGGKQPYQQNRVYSDSGLMTTLDTDSGRKSVFTDYRIRRLTPRECFRLMDFDDSFKFVVSNTQLYKQAGNSIVVAVLAGIIEKLKL